MHSSSTMESTRNDRRMMWLKAVAVFIACLLMIAALVLAAIMLSMIREGNTATSSKPVASKNAVASKHEEGKGAKEYTT